uniref:Xylose isomerase-like TIM barrel domain-containing protein n=1 Tax=viral metagenome TaxID=1070528 RepID=A0A6C0EA04_9ZZZZ
MFGLHINSETKYINDEIRLYHKKGCNIIQLFIDPFYKDKTSYEKFAKYALDNNIIIIIHASYTINCAQDWTEHSWWIEQFIMTIQVAKKLSAYAVVIHLGKQLTLTYEQGLNNMYSSLMYVHTKTKDCQSVKILLETSTGQGTEMCYKLDEFSYFFKKLSNHKTEDVRNRFGICLDTCHVFSAGNDIRTKRDVKKFLERFEKLLGLTNVKLIHLNDSKKELGSNVDRHENLGKGFIGLEPLLIINDFFVRMNVPVILETPDKFIENDITLIDQQNKS